MMRRLRSCVVVICSALGALGAAAQTGTGGTSTGGGATAASESFKSDPFSGAMTTAFPIKIPAGANGFQPSIALSYNSHRGTTWIGRGWDLDFGSIRRDTSDRMPSYSDDPETGDHFLWNDDRLVRANNGYYRPMIDDFSRVQRVDDAQGAVLHWVVHGADGTTSWYGYSASHRLSGAGGTRIWLLERMQAPNGNFIRFMHDTTSDPGNAYPEKIAYSFRGDDGESLGSSMPSSPTVRSIEFLLESRPDDAIAYEGGTRVLTQRRLREIRAYMGSSLVSEYELTYLDETAEGVPRNHRSLLYQVRVFGSDGESRLPTPVYRYTHRTIPEYASGSPLATAYRTSLPSGTDFRTPEWNLFDVNGDGAMDVVYTQKDGPVDAVYLNKKAIAGGGFFPSSSAGPTELYEIPILDTDGADGPWVPVELWLDDEPLSPSEIDVRWIDFDGDGLVDIVAGRKQFTSAGVTWQGDPLDSETAQQMGDGLLLSYQGTYRNTGYRWEQLTYEPIFDPAPPPYYEFPTAPARLMRCVTQDPTGEWRYAFIPMGYTEFIDVDLDGLPDVLEHAIPDPQSISCYDYITTHQNDIEAWRDLFTIRNVFMNTGDGWDEDPEPGWSSNLATLLDASGATLGELRFFDLNGDGILDVGPDPDGDGAVTGSLIRIGTGDIAAGWRTTSQAGFGSIPSELRPADVDGDGLADHVDSSQPYMNRGDSFVAVSLSEVAPWVSTFQPDRDRLVDLDGDGLLDVVRSTNSGPRVRLSYPGDEAGAKVYPQGLLEEVAFPAGGALRVGYEASSAGSCYDATSGGCHALFVSWSSTSNCVEPRIRGDSTPAGFLPSPTGGECGFPLQRLPIQVQTVASLEVDDGLGGVSVDRSASDLGFYSRRDRQFRGFGRVTQFAQSHVYDDPISGSPIPVAPVTLTHFYQGDYLRGQPAVALQFRQLTSGALELLRASVAKYFIQNGASTDAYVLQGTEFKLACDVDEVGETEDCDDFLTVQELTSGWTLPRELPFDRFHAAFGSSNRDSEHAYLVLEAGGTDLIYDGETTPVQFETVKFHDPYGNPQLTVRLGDLADPSDDRAEVAVFAEDQCYSQLQDPDEECFPSTLPKNLHRLPSGRIRGALTTTGTLVSLEATSLYYDGLGNGWTATGNLTRRATGLGPDLGFEDFVYDAGHFGQPSSVSDRYAAGDPPVYTTKVYDAAKSFIVEETYGGTFTRRTAYDPSSAPRGLGLVYWTEDENESWVARGYDTFGRPTCVTRRYDASESSPPSFGNACNLDVVEARTYDDFVGIDLDRSRVTSTISDGNGNEVSTYGFQDGLGRVVRTERDGLETDSSGAEAATRIVSDLEYDLTGEVRFQSRPYFEGSAEAGSGTTYLRDELGRQRFIVQPNGGVVELLPFKLTTEIIDPEGRRRMLRRNGVGEVVEVVEDPDGDDLATLYGYDAIGRLRYVCDSLAASCPALVCEAGSCTTTGGDARHVTYVDYDSLSRRTVLLDPDSGVSTFAFDVLGNVVLSTNANGESISRVYDDLGRLKCENPTGVNSCDSALGADVVYTYGDEASAPGSDNAVNRPYAVSTETATYTYKYTASGGVREAAMELDAGATTYLRSFGYDWLDRMTSAQYPDGETVTHAYDSMGTERVESSQRVYVSTVGFNAAGYMQRLAYGNGVVRTFSHRASDGRVEHISDAGPSGLVFDRSYGFDLTGKLSSIADAIDPAESLTGIQYDPIGRLESLMRGGSESLAYVYDEIGNLRAKEGDPLPFDHPSKPHAIFDASSPQRWSYDAAGNMVAREGEVLAYDARSRLVEHQGELTSTYSYDHQGERSRRVQGADVSVFFGLDLEVMNGKRFVKTIQIGGLSVARRALVIPGAGSGVTAIRSREEWRRQLELVMAAGGVLGLLLILWAVHGHRGSEVLRPASASALAVTLLLAHPAHAYLSSPSGDLNGDGQIDVADVLLIERMTSGSLESPTPEQVENADVAPLEVQDGSVDVGDVSLLLRAAAGEDVDADTLAAETELSLGTSPFRADTDGDGVADDAELQTGTDPTKADTDEDGLSDGEESVAGTDPFVADTDDDGVVDGRDGAPLDYSAEETHFLHADHLGSTAVVTDAVGAVVRTLYNGIWGDRRRDELGPGAFAGAPALREAYTGQTEDGASGLLYYGARYYDPQLGRFLRPDPVVPDLFNPQALNRYAYVANDPLNLTDPTGNFFGGLGGFFGGIASSVGGFLGGLGRGLWSGITNIAQGFWGLGQSFSQWINSSIQQTIMAIVHRPAAKLATFISEAAAGIRDALVDNVVNPIAALLPFNKEETRLATESQGEYASVGGGEAQSPDSRWVGGSYEQMMEASTNAFDYVGDAWDIPGQAPFAHAVRDGVHGTIYPDGFRPGNLGIIDAPFGPGRIRAAIGPLKQWIRLGPSYSKFLGQPTSLSLRWGASPAAGGKYLQQIGSPTLRRFNQYLRGLKLPGSSWRVQDPGHFHIWM